MILINDAIVLFFSPFQRGKEKPTVIFYANQEKGVKCTLSHGRWTVGSKSVAPAAEKLTWEVSEDEKVMSFWLFNHFSESWGN